MKQALTAKKSWGQRFRRDYLSHWQLYLFLLLPIIYLILFDYIPMAGAQIAFRDFNPQDGIWGSPWVGWKNFERFFNSYQFWDILFNTLFLSIYGLLVSFPLPIILALVLNSFPGVRFKKTVQTVSYIPHFISTVVIVGMLMQLFNPRTGAIGNIYTHLTGNVMKDLFAEPSAFPHLYVWSGIWQSIGWNSIIYMAALAGIDPDLYEAAHIDGCGRLRQIWHITLPGIVPTMVTLLILSIGGLLSANSDKILLLYSPLTYETGDVIGTFVYRRGIKGGDFSYSTAVSLFQTVINFLLLIFANWFSNKTTETSLW